MRKTRIAGAIAALALALTGCVDVEEPESAPPAQEQTETAEPGPKEPEFPDAPDVAPPAIVERIEDAAKETPPRCDALQEEFDHWSEQGSLEMMEYVDEVLSAADCY